MYFISSLTETRGFMSPRRGVVAGAGEGLDEQNASVAVVAPHFFDDTLIATLEI